MKCAYSDREEVERGVKADDGDLCPVVLIR